MFEHRSIHRRTPIVGRNEELQRLMDALSQALSNNGSTVFIAGEAGIGKTRLAVEIEEFAHLSGFRVLVGNCIPGAPYAYLPFREALHNISGGGQIDAGKELDSLQHVFDILDNAAEGTPDFARYGSINDRLLVNLMDALTEASTIAPVLIRLEDLHWSDGASLGMLRYLSRNIGHLRVLVVATYRTEELTSGGDRGVHPLVETVRAMNRERTCSVITLGPLGEKDIKEAVEGLLSGRLEGKVSNKIFSESGGNPLFAVETALLMVNEDHLRLDKGLWVSTQEARLEVPRTVKEIILRRLDIVPHKERRVLEAASVIGESFDPDIIKHVLSLDNLAMLESLESLDRDYHMLHEKFRDYAFDHEMIRQTTYDAISRPRRRELHSIIGQYLEARPGTITPPGTLSNHFYYAQQWDKCLTYSLRTGDGMLKSYTASEALPYYKRAVEVIEKNPSLAAWKLVAVEGLADAYQETLDFRKADRLYQEIFPLLTDNNSRARVLRKRHWCWEPGRMAQGSLTMGISLIKEASEIPDVEPLERAEIMLCLSHVLAMQGDIEGALERWKKAMDVFRQEGNLPKLAWELCFYANMDIQAIRLEDAIEKLDEAKELIENNPWFLVSILIEQHRAIIKLFQGRYEEAIAGFKDSIVMCKKIGDHGDAGHAYLHIAIACEEMGDFISAQAWLDRCLEIDARLGRRLRMCVASGLLAYLAMVAGDREGAEERLKEAKEDLGVIDDSYRTYATGLVTSISGMFELLYGNTMQGRTRFEEGIADLNGVRMGVFYEAIVRRWYGESLEQVGLAQEAKEEYRRAEMTYGLMKNEHYVEKMKEKSSGV
jgi:tetratricopeptide (TPR) repeat protein